MKQNDAYLLIDQPTAIPVPGGKQIHEYLGRVNTDTDRVSVARMEAPAGWSEPAQTPAFDEITIMLDGQLQVTINGKSLEISAGQVLSVNRGTRVQYENPHGKMAIYWAICIPAFSLELAGRDLLESSG
ncbi:MAG: cupin domain-containing protein [Candidatus Marinimicrobia bacterium]|nr:cupin domain-containing protein [Candidatus Neomarinimicrobiota bacterium]MCF7839467.1 cupin domain-containing protein [Candidatus Neomarinimicrobiota bacterium]MCF7901857.1 cupin domain-containing protein [Candidatus Neomarinimicrobiota bacterium]